MDGSTFWTSAANSVHSAPDYVNFIARLRSAKARTRTAHGAYCRSCDIAFFLAPVAVAQPVVVFALFGADLMKLVRVPQKAEGHKVHSLAVLRVK